MNSLLKITFSKNFSSRQVKNPSSKSTKRLTESQKAAEQRRNTRKKYQNAIKQRSEALNKNALDRVEKLSLDDPHVSTDYDLWNTYDERKSKNKVQFFISFLFYLLEEIRSLIGPELAAYTDQVYEKYDWKVPNHIIKKPSKLPPIEKPLPGTSYNPTYDDHQVKINSCIVLIYFSTLNKDLLRRAVDVELEKERKELKLLRNLPKLLTQNAAQPIKVNMIHKFYSI